MTAGPLDKIIRIFILIVKQSSLSTCDQVLLSVDDTIILHLQKMRLSTRYDFLFKNNTFQNFRLTTDHGQEYKGRMQKTRSKVTTFILVCSVDKRTVRAGQQNAFSDSRYLEENTNFLKKNYIYLLNFMTKKAVALLGYAQKHLMIPLS
ncbi:unnamed protein product [Albugo candida]|uniref:Uncharacterized protein n=1 Tax=Albugo candida TaxID=65357 RepID=A0A024GN85_9STRA|nr:unnamed protein product [Albugo candida]|eukprot:CCI47965.1 unnamed protein product [Albugo candida]